jgi:hypothetical protein
LVRKLLLLTAFGMPPLLNTDINHDEGIIRNEARAKASYCESGKSRRVCEKS